MWFFGLILILSLLGPPLFFLFYSPFSIFPLFILGEVIFLGILCLLGKEPPQYSPSGHPPAKFHQRGGDSLFVSVKHPPHSSSSSSSSTPSPSPSPSPSPPPTLLLLHGILASHRFWDQLSPLLSSRGATCLVPDLLGFGRSPWLSGSQNYTMKQQCEWLIRDAISLADPSSDLHFIGHSMGSLIALELAASLPPDVRIASITLISSPCFLTSKVALETVEKNFLPYCLYKFPNAAWILCSLLCQQRWLWSRPLSFLLSSLSRFFFPSTFLPKEVVEDFFLHSYESALESLLNCILTYNLQEAMQIIEARGIQVRLVHGDQDETIPIDIANQFALKYATPIHIVSGGHSLPLHQTVALDQIIGEFIQPSSSRTTKRFGVDSTSSLKQS